MKSRQIIIIIAAVSIIGGAVGLSNFLSKQKEIPEKKEVKEFKKYVKTEKVDYADLQTQVIGYGRVQTAESQELIAEVPGKMTRGEMSLKEGQRFRKGALLYIIDDTEAKLNLQAQKSNFLKDLAAILPDFKIDFPDNFQVWQGYFNAIELEKDLPELPVYRSDKEKTFLATKSIFNSYYSIRSSEVNLKKYKTYAPFDCSIAEVYLQSGSFVNPGSKIAMIMRSDKLELKVAVATNDIDWIKIGNTAYLSSEEGPQTWVGVIVRMGEHVNQNTQSIDVYIAIQLNEHKVYDGLYLKAAIPGKVVNQSMIIPRNAVFNGTQVFVVKDSLLQVKEIVIQKVNPETVVFSGLRPGEDVVIEPLVNAYNNMKVFKLSEQPVDSQQTVAADSTEVDLKKS